MYDDMLASGSRYLSAAFIQEGIGEIAGDQAKYNDALKLSKELGVDVNDVIRAQAGDIEKGNQLLDDTNRKRQEEIDTVNASNDSLDNKAVKVDAINTKYGELTDGIYDVVSASDSAAARFGTAQSAMSDYLLDVVANSKDATREVTEFGDTIVTLPDGKQVIIDAETGQATDDMDTVETRNFTPKTVPVKMTVDDSAVTGWRAPMLYGTVTVSPKNSPALDRLLNMDWN
jgi:hypothetical protein